MYFEFKVYMSIGRIQKEFFNGINVDIKPREGTQAEAIKSCSDLSNNLIINDYFDL
jgi:hypothetical protein